MIDYGVFKLYPGDCLESLRRMPDNSVDSVVTDPPYGLSFMGRAWDYDVPKTEVWAECLRVLKPGGHLLSFAGTRTQHRMCVRIEDAGFDIRDMIAWVYGSGFPKSMDVSKAIDKAAGAEREVIGRRKFSATTSANFRDDGWAPDLEKLSQVTAPATDAARQWQGWGTALKPAMEPITVARKPLAGTVADNVLSFGVGALNIDKCRVETTDDLNGCAYAKSRQESNSEWAKSGSLHESTGLEFVQPAGRWPANLIHDGSDEVLGAFPVAPGTAGRARTDGADQGNNTFGALKHVTHSPEPREDAGSAARFFYCAKASKPDRNRGGVNNAHPTVKPTDLMRYLCRLVTPPGGVVLDAFMGSGSTGVAAALEGFRFIGCERDADSLSTAEARIFHAAFGMPLRAST